MPVAALLGLHRGGLHHKNVKVKPLVVKYLWQNTSSCPTAARPGTAHAGKEQSLERPRSSVSASGDGSSAPGAHLAAPREGERAASRRWRPPARAGKLREGEL